MALGILIGYILGTVVTLFLFYRKRHPKMNKSVRKDLNKSNEEDF